ncbi:hypothetical protein LNKW23_24780 [Paralimibaculum aggregatum]|uniref:Uncharacterized protein n=1 Tax=Paralimibaculum aggregatum TaxID=3036245 RepID=A0ABQ6LJ09_9RHOB|nr:hypothetical protein LNKW23_24780 [Limibaculum sp. NKW23]
MLTVAYAAALACALLARDAGLGFWGSLLVFWLGGPVWALGLAATPGLRRAFLAAGAEIGSGWDPALPGHEPAPEGWSGPRHAGDTAAWIAQEEELRAWDRDLAWDLADAGTQAPPQRAARGGSA